MRELIFYDDLNSWGTTKKYYLVAPCTTRWDPQLHVFPQILKEKKYDDQFSKSKKSLLRNTKSDKLYILGVRWITCLAFVRHVNRRVCVIACHLLTDLTVSVANCQLRVILVCQFVTTYCLCNRYVIQDFIKVTAAFQLIFSSWGSDLFFI